MNWDTNICLSHTHVHIQTVASLCAFSPSTKAHTYISHTYTSTEVQTFFSYKHFLTRTHVHIQTVALLVRLFSKHDAISLDTKSAGKEDRTGMSAEDDEGQTTNIAAEMGARRHTCIFEVLASAAQVRMCVCVCLCLRDSVCIVCVRACVRACVFEVLGVACPAQIFSNEYHALSCMAYTIYKTQESPQLCMTLTPSSSLT
jgi:hypothetical protein